MNAGEWYGSDPEPDEPEEEYHPWPAELGWYWASGEDRGNPVEGIARLGEAGHFNGVDRDWQDWSIWPDDVDRLDSAVRVTPVPTEEVQALREAVDDGDELGAVSIARDILAWLDQHEEAQR